MPLVANQKVMHEPGCGDVAFYVVAFPIRRRFIPDDALNIDASFAAMGNRIECISCHKKVDLTAVSDYYEMEGE